MYKSMVYTQLFKGEHIVVSGSMSAYFFLLFSSNFLIRLIITVLLLSDGVNCVSVWIGMISPVTINTHCVIADSELCDGPSDLPSC